MSATHYASLRDAVVDMGAVGVIQPQAREKRTGSIQAPCYADDTASSSILSHDNIGIAFSGSLDQYFIYAS